MCGIISKIVTWLVDSVGSDFYANITATIELIVAVIALLIGGEKVSEFITEYKRKRMEAIFGFYTNLGFFIKRIRPLIAADDDTPLETLYLLSPTDELKSIKGYDILAEKLSAVSYECLQYLSSKADQIPPAHNKDERNLWKKNLDIFVNYLNQFYLIGSGISLPNLEDEKGIEIYYQGIKLVFDQIEKKVEDETVKFYEQMEEINAVE